MNRVDLPPKLSGEIRNYTFDFSSLLATSETISTQKVTATVYSGTDADPSRLVAGTATASGAIVTQKLKEGTTGVIYKLVCEITTSANQLLQMVGLLAVVPNEI